MLAGYHGAARQARGAQAGLKLVEVRGPVEVPDQLREAPVSYLLLVGVRVALDEAEEVRELQRSRGMQQRPEFLDAVGERGAGQEELPARPGGKAVDLLVGLPVLGPKQDLGALRPGVLEPVGLVDDQDVPRPGHQAVQEGLAVHALEPLVVEDDDLGVRRRGACRLDDVDLERPDEPLLRLAPPVEAEARGADDEGGLDGRVGVDKA